MELPGQISAEINSGGLKDAAGLEAAFGGSAYFRNDDTGFDYLGIWGTRNGGAFRNRIREAGMSVEIVHKPPPASLKWFSKGTRGQRPRRTARPTSE